MSAITDFFGDDSAIRQILLWSVVGQLINPIIAPVAQQVSDATWSNATKTGVSIPLSPAEAALGVLRGDLTQAEGEAMASENGTDAADFATMLANTGEPISIEQALFLLRRGYLQTADVEKVIRQSRVRDEWTQAILDLNFVPVTASDAVDAAVQNQIDYSAARDIAYQNGIQASDFDLLYNTRGRPPGPTELLEMVRRGVIPESGTGVGVVSLEQGISESAIKDKWIPVYDALLQYLPPPRTVTALERQGVITPAQAQSLYQAAGLSPQLAAVYSSSATSTKLTKARTETESQILSAYLDQFIDASVATTMLEGLGYTAAEVTTLLSWEDAKRELALIKQAITKIGTLFVARKIGVTTATNALNVLGVSATQQDHLLTTWSLEQSIKLPLITPAQIGAGVEYQVISPAQGLQALQDLGYTPWDSWFYLSQHLHQALPNEPPMDTPTGQLP